MRSERAYLGQYKLTMNDAGASIGKQMSCFFFRSMSIGHGMHSEMKVASGNECALGGQLQYVVDDFFTSVFVLLIADVTLRVATAESALHGTLC